MIQFTTRILRFELMGEKTGWSYLEIPADIAEAINPGYKRAFRVKGKLDNYPVEKIALMPMGDGSFIMPFNAEMRKTTGKRVGAMLKVSIELDKRNILINTELVTCLADEPEALKFFNSLNRSMQGYFSKWVDTAKTDGTKAKRIAECVNALLLHRDFGEMMRENKNRDKR